MKTPVFLAAALALVSAASAQSTRHNFSAPPQDVLWPAQIVDGDLLTNAEWAGDFAIQNDINNTLFVDDNYLATGNANGITGRALWGNPESGFPLGFPHFRMTFDGYFLRSFPDNVLVDQVTQVSFDFAWASTDVDAELHELAIEIMDYNFNTETIYVELTDTFFHSLIGGGEGYSGRVTVQPEEVANVFSIRFVNLGNAGPPGHVGEFAIDNLEIIQNGQGVDDVYPVDSLGNLALGYSTNSLKGVGTFSSGAGSVTNRGPGATNFSVLWAPSDPALYHSFPPQNNAPIASQQTVPFVMQWAVDTNTTPSGTYSGVFTVVNNGAPLDPDNQVNISAFRLYDPPALSVDDAITKGPGDFVNLANAVVAAHPGALRASAKVKEVTVTGPRFGVSGIAAGDQMDAGESLAGTVSFNASGAAPGTYTAELRVKLEMASPTESYLNAKQPMADRVWTLSYTVGSTDIVTAAVTTGQNLGGAGLEISGGGSAANLIDGNSSADQEIEVAFVPSPPVTNPAGTARAVETHFSETPSLYVLQLTYPDLPAGHAEVDLRIHVLGGGNWVPAISLNGNGGNPVAGAAPFSGSYATFLSGLGGGSLDAADLGAYGVDAANNRAWVVVDYDGIFQITLGEPIDEEAAPVITGVSYDANSNTVTLSYHSVAGATFTVLGSPNLAGFAPVGTTPVGNGSVMQFTHQPPGAPGRYFYRLSNP